MQRKLAAEQVAAAMGQAPPVTSVAAGAVKMGLSMGALPPPVARAPVASPAVQVRRMMGRHPLTDAPQQKASDTQGMTRK